MLYVELFLLLVKPFNDLDIYSETTVARIQLCRYFKLYFAGKFREIPLAFRNAKNAYV